MIASVLALALAANPAQPGVYRRAAPAPDGVHLAVYVYLPERPIPDAPLVVLLPELGTTHEVFDLRGEGLAHDLVDRGLAVATLDWRGTGLSQLPPQPAALDELLSQDIPTVVDALGAGRDVVVVGGGWAGALAYAAAVGPLAPRVRGVVGLDAVVDADVPNPIVERLFSEQSALELARDLASPAPSRHGSTFDLLWVYPSSVDPALVAHVQDHVLAPISASEVAQVADWMHTRTTQLGGRAYPAMLQGLKTPVLAFEGVRDNWAHPEFADAIRDRASHVTLHVVDTFEGYHEDGSHLGLVLGRMAHEQIAPAIAQFVIERGGAR